MTASAHLQLARSVGGDDHLYHCDTCSPSMRLMLGHDGPPTNFWTENLLTGERLAECPLRTILRAGEKNPQLAREIDSHLRYHPAYERGVLLVAGGLNDQPARYLDLMTMIDQQRRAVEAKHLEVIRKDAEENSHHGS